MYISPEIYQFDRSSPNGEKYIFRKFDDSNNELVFMYPTEQELSGTVGNFYVTITADSKMVEVAHKDNALVCFVIDDLDKSFLAIVQAPDFDGVCEYSFYQVPIEDLITFCQLGKFRHQVKISADFMNQN